MISHAPTRPRINRKHHYIVEFCVLLRQSLSFGSARQYLLTKCDVSLRSTEQIEKLKKSLVQGEIPYLIGIFFAQTQEVSSTEDIHVGFLFGQTQSLQHSRKCL